MQNPGNKKKILFKVVLYSQSNSCALWQIKLKCVDFDFQFSPIDFQKTKSFLHVSPHHVCYPDSVSPYAQTGIL